MNAQVERIANPLANSPVVAAPNMGASAQALIAREAQNIQVQMMMARHFPRDQMKALDRIINAFTIPELCEDALYAYSKGGSSIGGLSIRAAEVLMQNWGNIRSGIDELTRVNGQSEFLTYAQDLETGTIDEKKFFVRHWIDSKKGGRATTDEREIYELGANYGARRKRANILAIIPKHVQNAAERQIEVTLKSKAEVTPDSIKGLLEAFGRFNVTKEMIEKRIQRHIEAMLPAQLINMRRVYASLKDGMSSPEDWFEITPASSESTDGGPKSTTQSDAVKEALRAKQAGQQKTTATSGDVGKSDDLGGYVPHHDEKSALAAIRDAKDEKAFDEAASDVLADFKKSNRPLPDSIEPVIGDRREYFKQQKQKL